MSPLKTDGEGFKLILLSYVTNTVKGTPLEILVLRFYKRPIIILFYRKLKTLISAFL